MDADQPVIAPFASQISPTAQDQLRLAIVPLVAATETPTQCNANRTLRCLTHCLNRTHPLTPATLINVEAEILTSIYLARPPSCVIELTAGSLKRPSAGGLMRKNAIQDITAPFGVHTEMASYDMQCKLGIAIIWMVEIQCPSLSVARDVFHELLVEAARPESLPKLRLKYGRETPAPETRPLPDPTMQ